MERVSEVLRQKLKQADILVLKRATLAEKRQEALEEQAKLEPRIDLLSARTKELQKLVGWPLTFGFFESLLLLQDIGWIGMGLGVHNNY